MWGCVSIWALQITPIHHCSYACCPCIVTLWFPDLYVCVSLIALELASLAYTLGDAVEDGMSQDITSPLISLDLPSSSCGSVGGNNDDRKTPPLTRNTPEAQWWCLTRESWPQKSQLLTSHTLAVFQIWLMFFGHQLHHIQICHGQRAVNWNCYSVSDLVSRIVFSTLCQSRQAWRISTPQSQNNRSGQFEPASSDNWLLPVQHKIDVIQTNQVSGEQNETPSKLERSNSMESSLVAWELLLFKK